MKVIFIFYFSFLYPVFSVIPLWNFDSSANNLLSDSNSITYKIYSKCCICDSKTVELTKTISKNDNVIREVNTLSIRDNALSSVFSQVVEWEDIESIYCIHDFNYICPKGSFHMNLFKNNNLYSYYPDGFSSATEWELQCYRQIQDGVNFMFMGYLNSNSRFYGYRFFGYEDVGGYDGLFIESLQLDSGLYDFKWTTTQSEILVIIK